MGELTVINPGLQTCLQDEGRPGLAFYAIPRSGPMDPHAAELANTILLNDKNAPVLECHFVPPALRFETEATISLTGADMGWQLDGASVRRQESLSIPAGSVLSGTAATTGCRAYIGICGSIQTERTFGSAACYALAGFGGNSGKPLTAGDKIRWRASDKAPFPLRLDLKTSNKKQSPLPILPGPEYAWLSEESKSAFGTLEFSISSDSNRMGARLHGPPLSTDGKTLTDSLPLLPGFMQLTPSGQTIVVLQDGQTTGGYPRIAYLPPETVARLNQIPMQQAFCFNILERHSG